MLGTVLLSGCSGTSGTPQGVLPEKIDKSPIEQTSENKEPVKKTFKLGEIIKLGDYVVTITNFDDKYKASNQFLQPKEGNKLVSVEVLYENSTADKTLSYNSFDWKLFDNEGYNFDPGFAESKEPALNSGDINPSGKAKGWVTFEVPEKTSQFKIQFSPSLWENDNAEIQLY